MLKLNIPDISVIASMNALSAPVWIFDLERHAMWWANEAAVSFWKADRLEELAERDFSSDSNTLRQRLRQIVWDKNISQGVAETWTLYPSEEPVTITARVQPVTIGQGGDAVLVEVVSGGDVDVDVQRVRLEEMVNYSGVMLSMFTLSGKLLAQNAAAFACYGAATDAGDDLLNRLGSPELVQELFETIEREEVFDTEVEVHTQADRGKHRVKAQKGRDPATGDYVAILSEDDISDLVDLRLELSALNAHLEERVSQRSESLKVSEERFSLAMQGANDGLWDRNFETGEVYFSPRWLEILGYGADDPPPDMETIQSLVHPDDLSQVMERVIRPEPSETPLSEAEFRIRHQEGHWIDVLSREFLVVRDGKVARIVGTYNDISERKRSERSLNRLKEILFEGSEALPLGVAYYDQDFKLVMNNSFYEKALPISAHLLERGVHFGDILRNSADYFAGQFGYDNPEEYVQERLKAARIEPQEWVHEQSTGRTVVATELPTTGNGVISMIEDVTNDRAQQKQLQQAQKMEAIGQLTGGVAHDFNNLLAVIMGNLELLQSEIGSDSFDVAECVAFIEAAVDAVKHGADLTRSMLAYARKARLEPVVLDINKTVRETERWMRRTIRSNIQIETALQAGIWPIKVDKNSLQSALVNLIVNARDAIDGSGKLTLETANLRIDDTYLEARSEKIPPGRYVMVAVTDTGRGISPEAIEHIYDPFFTTKAVGQGTGLGLSMVEGFVRQSGGTVRVYSEVGEGTSFKLYFAALAHDVLEAKEERAALKSSSNSRRDARPRLLLAEDNLDVMAVLEKTLVLAGYDVTTAITGDIAYAVFNADPSFDVVLTDIVMPGRLQGPEFAKECRLLRPSTPFVFLSGYASEATVHGNGLRPEDIRLMKPVSRVDLLQAVEKSLKLKCGDGLD